MRKAIFRPSYLLHKMKDFGLKMTNDVTKNDPLEGPLRDFKKKSSWCMYTYDF